MGWGGMGSGAPLGQTAVTDHMAQSCALVTCLMGVPYCPVLSVHSADPIHPPILRMCVWSANLPIGQRFIVFVLYTVYSILYYSLATHRRASLASTTSGSPACGQVDDLWSGVG